MYLVVTDVFEALESDLRVGDVVGRLLRQLQAALQRYRGPISEPVAHHRLAPLQPVHSDQSSAVILRIYLAS